VEFSVLKIVGIAYYLCIFDCGLFDMLVFQ